MRIHEYVKVSIISNLMHQVGNDKLSCYIHTSHAHTSMGVTDKAFLQVHIC